MANPKTSLKRAQSISTSIFLTGLAIVCYTNTWWPGILLVVGIPLGIRQYLFKKAYDTLMTLFIFIGFFITVAFDISWEILLPFIFLAGAIQTLLREFSDPDIVN